MDDLPIPGTGDLPISYRLGNMTHNLLVLTTQNVTAFNASDFNDSLLGDRTIFTYSPHDVSVNIILIIIFILVIIWTIVGNLTVIVSVKTSPALRASPSNILVTNLALSDLFLGLLVLPFSSTVEVAGFWPLGRELCYLWLLIDVLLCTASIWSLLIIAVDRYTATFYPIWYRTKHQTRRLIMYITIIWVVSASASLPPLFVKSMLMDSYHPDANPPGCQLFDTLDFVLYSSVMTFILPATILFILYGRIFCELKRRSVKLNEMKKEYRMSLQHDGVTESHPINQQLHELEEENSTNSGTGSNSDSHKHDTSMSSNSPQKQNESYNDCEKSLLNGQNDKHSADKKPTKDNKRKVKESVKCTSPTSRFSVMKKAASKHRKDRREERATRIMLIIMLCFIVCWLPFFIMYITRSALSKSCPHCVSNQVQTFLIWLGYINSAINPLLYAAFNRQFREAFKAVWCGRLEDLRRQRFRSMAIKSTKSKFRHSINTSTKSSKTVRVEITSDDSIRNGSKKLQPPS